MCHERARRQIERQAPLRVREGEAAADIDAEAGLGVAAVTANAQLQQRRRRRSAIKGDAPGAVERKPQPSHIGLGPLQLAAFTLIGLGLGAHEQRVTHLRQRRAAVLARRLQQFAARTLVEFFYYQCGYCKRSLKPVTDLLASDGRLREVWKEFPILGPVSRFAARAAMASEKEDRYLEFHVAVMGSRGKLTEDRVMAIAGSVGLDVQRLRRDMDDPAIEEYLDETIRLARILGIGGTSAFVIGDTLVPGAVGGDRLKELIATARSRG